jgi:molybdopterin synthase sulfur carrier subunit
MAAAPVRVHIVFSDGFSHQYTNGEKEFDLEVRNFRGIIKQLDDRFPGLGAHLEEETSVAIDGQIHENTAYFQQIRDGSEIFFIPKLEGG